MATGKPALTLISQNRLLLSIKPWLRQKVTKCSTVSGLDNPVIDAAEQLGSAIMVVDFNADGVEDLIIGASADDSPGIDAGSVYFKLYP